MASPAPPSWLAFLAQLQACYCSHAQNDRFMMLMTIVSTCVLGANCITCMHADEGLTCHQAADEAAALEAQQVAMLPLTPELMQSLAFDCLSLRTAAPLLASDDARYDKCPTLCTPLQEMLLESDKKLEALRLKDSLASAGPCSSVTPPACCSPVDPSALSICFPLSPPRLLLCFLNRCLRPFVPPCLTCLQPTVILAPLTHCNAGQATTRQSGSACSMNTTSTRACSRLAELLRKVGARLGTRLTRCASSPSAPCLLPLGCHALGWSTPYSFILFGARLSARQVNACGGLWVFCAGAHMYTRS